MTPLQFLLRMWRSLNTLKVLYGASGIVGVWEMWTIANPIAGDTVSATVQELGNEQLFIPLMHGLLAGHLWRNPWTRAAVVVGFVVGWLFWPLLDKRQVEAAK